MKQKCWISRAVTVVSVESECEGLLIGGNIEIPALMEVTKVDGRTHTLPEVRAQMYCSFFFSRLLRFLTKESEGLPEMKRRLSRVTEDGGRASLLEGAMGDGGVYHWGAYVLTHAIPVLHAALRQQSAAAHYKDGRG